eukprot:GHVU01179405.1.p1 GENE.GHVU01179405.1~~GHVU01179405.1.p1  ORF type:complete len:541 (-),score=89.13 GHVU01179405.1:583-2205(-)
MLSCHHSSSYCLPAIRMVEESDDVWVVFVYRDNDEYSSGISSHWEAAAAEASGVPGLKFGRINFDTDRRVARRLPIRVRLTPTILMFEPKGSMAPENMDFMKMAAGSDALLPWITQHFPVVVPTLSSTEQVSSFLRINDNQPHVLLESRFVSPSLHLQAAIRKWEKYFPFAFLDHVALLEKEKRAAAGGGSSVAGVDSNEHSVATGNTNSSSSTNQFISKFVSGVPANDNRYQPDANDAQDDGSSFQQTAGAVGGSARVLLTMCAPQPPSSSSDSSAASSLPCLFMGSASVPGPLLQGADIDSAFTTIRAAAAPHLTPETGEELCRSSLQQRVYCLALVNAANLERIKDVQTLLQKGIRDRELQQNDEAKTDRWPLIQPVLIDTEVRAAPLMGTRKPPRVANGKSERFRKLHESLGSPSMLLIDLDGDRMSAIANDETLPLLQSQDLATLPDSSLDFMAIPKQCSSALFYEACLLGPQKAFSYLRTTVRQMSTAKALLLVSAAYAVIHMGISLFKKMTKQTLHHGSSKGSSRHHMYLRQK